MEKMQRESEIVKDPHSLWTIENPGRVLEERAKIKKTNLEVKETLDQQVRDLNKFRANSREADLSVG